MDYRKTALYAALVVVALILWNSWQREFPPQADNPTITVATSTAPNISNVPGSSSGAVPTTNSLVPHTMAAKAALTSSKSSTTGKTISIKTDLLNLTIGLKGGDIEHADLLQYPLGLHDKTNKVTLFTRAGDNYYIAQSGITGPQGPDTQKGPVQYSTTKTQYTLRAGQKELVVPLVYRAANGLELTKTYTFKRDSYTIDTGYKIHNNSNKAWKGYVYTQLARNQPERSSSLIAHYASFTGGAISSPKEHYQKLKFKNFASEPVNENITGGWAAMIQQYFLTAWVPPAGQTYHYYTQANNNIYTVGMMGPQLTVHASQTLQTHNKLYVGPAIASRLNALAPYLSMTIDYGWLFFISKIIFWLMMLIHGFIGNWGWSIILTTIVIKALFYPLSDKSFRSMANMRKMQPRMQQLKERFADDRAGLSKATMELYRKEKINPLSGCLPILIQIPVFIALYWVIIQSVELRLAPWMFWIKDLSVHDPYYILPVLMGVCMFVQQKMSPPPPDPTQAKVMMFMPVIFTVFFLHFPAGLVLYWITNTLFTICHQFFVYKKVERADKMKKLTNNK